MSAPSTPVNFLVQQGNSQVWLTWNLSTGSTSYHVYRSTNNVTFAELDEVTPTNYLDEDVTVGTQYWYRVTADNGDESSATTSQAVIPTRTGNMALGQVRLLSQQKADRVNSNFVTEPEWNIYIRQSYFELYDILVQVYGDDYFVASPYQFTTTNTALYDLPDDFYKLLGVDMGISSNNNGWVTLKKFNFISRNRYVYPSVGSSALGVVNMRYRLLGNQIEFIPTPSVAQYIQLWYIPKLTEPLKDTDMLDGVSGWTEYVCVDAAIKALNKEESDVSALMAAKQMLLDRITSAANNRDAGIPDSISATRNMGELFGAYGTPNGDGSFGGY